MQNFSSGRPMLAGICSASEFRLPAADATVSFIDAEDIAAVGSAVLTEASHAGAAYTLTGGEALAHHQVARILSRVASRTISYIPESETDAVAALDEAGVARS